jgi:hypothetical protein
MGRILRTGYGKWENGLNVMLEAEIEHQKQQDIIHAEVYATA